MDGRRVSKCFGPFPPMGVSVLAPTLPLHRIVDKTNSADKIYADPQFNTRPWALGAVRLELAVVMMPGASFRIHREPPPAGVPATSYALWTGHQLNVTGRVTERADAFEAQL